jgi:pimeloyl-ACP methyl ester carboxylesterase/catechol 2,3-dioxygenase-like lactoylglutathione lyase family enzyme
MELDHFNIRTQKLAETVRFYEFILGLHSGARPQQPLNGNWMYNGHQAVLHLLESPSTAEATGPLDHVAFACRGLAEFLKRLDASAIPRIARAIPGTSMVQVQFLDPNGVMVEANFSDETLHEPGTSMAVDGHTYFSSLRQKTQPYTRTLEANGIQTAYEICGHGPLLVLIHGAEADRKSFASVLPELSKHFSCVTYDQRDTGETRNPPVDYTAVDLADDAASLINALGGKAHVWGSSFGGMVAQELALRHPGCVDSLILSVTFQNRIKAMVEPELFMALRDRQEHDSGARMELLSRFFSPETALERPELIQGALGAFMRRPHEIQMRRSRVTAQFESEGRLSAIRARTLVIGSLSDRVIDPLASLRIAKEIRGSTLTYLNGVGHAIAIEAPQRVTRIIREFLSTHE